MIEGGNRVDYSVFVHCTPLYDDVEWDPELEALKGSFDPPPPPNLNPIVADQGDPLPDGSGAILENAADDQLQVVADENLPEEVAEPLVVATVVGPAAAGQSDADAAGDDVLHVPELLVNPPQERRRRGRPPKRPREVSVSLSGPPESRLRRPSGRPPGRRSTSRPNPNPSMEPRLGRRRRIRTADFQLPEGWVEDRRIRKGGRSAGHADMYYVEESTGRRCRSRGEVLDYLSVKKEINQEQAYD